MYLLDGDLNIDNNPSENALRRIAAHPHHRLDELLPDRWQPQA